MSKLSEASRSRIRSLRRPEGVWVFDNKFTTARMRALPGPESAAGDGVFGEEYFQYWCPILKKFVTSPRTFGLMDPVLDWFDENRDKMRKNKDMWDSTKDIVSPRYSRVVKVVFANDLGTVSSPHVRMFPFPVDAYDAISAPAIENGMDITSPVDGVWFTLTQTKVPSKRAKWTVDAWGKPSPLFKNAALVKAALAKAATMSVVTLAAPLDWAIIAMIYLKLTRKPIPAKYTAQKGVKIVTKKLAAEEEVPEEGEEMQGEEETLAEGEDEAVAEEGGEETTEESGEEVTEETAEETAEEEGGEEATEEGEETTEGEEVVDEGEVAEEEGGEEATEEGEEATEEAGEETDEAGEETTEEVQDDEPHKFAIGDVVLYTHKKIEGGKTLRAKVTKRYKDEDGLNAYALRTLPEDSLIKPAYEEYMKKAPPVVKTGATVKPVSKASPKPPVKSTGKTAPATIKPKASDKIGQKIAGKKKK